MRKSITRTITSSTITSVNVVNENGELKTTVNAPLFISGKISPEKALKEIRKTYGENSFVNNIEEVENIYEISVEDFIKYATIVKVKEEGQENGE